jgi:hypothetical protein
MEGFELLMESSRFVMDLTFERSTWSKSVKTVYEKAREYNNQLFTYKGIEQLYNELLPLAGKQPAALDLRKPSWDGYFKYNLRPSISIDPECLITFIPIKGDYPGN